MSDTTDGQSFGFAVVAEADARPTRYGIDPLTRDRPRGNAPVNDLRVVDADEARALLNDEPGGWAFEPHSGGYVERTSNHSDVAEVFNDEDGPLVAAAPDLAYTVITQRAAVLAIHTHGPLHLADGTVEVCDVCSYGDDDEALSSGGWAHWPCPTARALGVTE